MEESIYQRARIVTRGGMDDHSCRLIDDHHVRVLVHDGQIEVLCSWRGFFEFGNVELNRYAGLDPVIRFREAAVDLDEALVDQLLDVRTRLARDDRRKKAVEALAIVLVRNGYREWRNVRQPSAPVQAQARSAAPVSRA